jgi:hypothetical protein
MFIRQVKKIRNKAEEALMSAHRRFSTKACCMSSALRPVRMVRAMCLFTTRLFKPRRFGGGSEDGLPPDAVGQHLLARRAFHEVDC